MFMVVICCAMQTCSGELMINSSEYQTTAHGASKSALVITEANPSDSGKYTCVVTRHGAIRQTLSTLLTVQGQLEPKI